MHNDQMPLNTAATLSEKAALLTRRLFLFPPRFAFALALH